MHFRTKGFSLIELMIVLLVMGIIATIALPNMSHWIAKRKVLGKAEQAANLLHFSRAEAIRLGAPVYVCPVMVKTDGDIDKLPECSNQYLQQGVAAYADVEKDGNYKRNSKDLDLRSLIINEKNTSKIKYSLAAWPFDGQETAVSVLGFLPSGAFGYGTVAGVNQLDWSTGSVRMIFTDVDDPSVSATVVIDSGGRSAVCVEGEQETRELCKTEKK